MNNRPAERGGINDPALRLAVIHPAHSALCAGFIICKPHSSQHIMHYVLGILRADNKKRVAGRRPV